LYLSDETQEDASKLIKCYMYNQSVCNMRKSKTSNRINELKFLIDCDTDSVKALFTSD